MSFNTLNSPKTATLSRATITSHWTFVIFSLFPMSHYNPVVLINFTAYNFTNRPPRKNGFEARYVLCFNMDYNRPALDGDIVCKEIVVRLEIAYEAFAANMKGKNLGIA